MSKLPWRRTPRGNYVSGKYLIMWVPVGTRRRWTLYDEGHAVHESERLGDAKKAAQERAS